MSAQSTLILAGILVALTPFLGLPSAWYPYIFAILGLTIFSIGLLLRARYARTPHARTGSSAPSNISTEAPHAESPHEPSPMA